LGRAKPAGVVSAPTAAQNAFWRKWRAHDPDAPARFTPGRYKCPAHPDTGRSLKLTYRDNRVDVTCFDAGCGKQAILDRLGLRRVDLDDYGPAAGGKPVGVFAYHDERGAEVLRAHRYVAPVGVRYEHFRDGGWEWAPATRGPHVLYRLGDVLAAIETEERVFVVDDEQAADALREAGVTATTAAYRPPGKPWRPEYVERLHGAYCTVVARKHEAGRKHARNLAAMLLDAGAADVALIEPATAKHGGDAADHLAAGFGLDDFAPLSADTEPERAAAAPVVQVERAEGAGILAGVEETYRRFVHYSNDHQAVAVTLWTAHTWAIDAFDVTPYMHFKSPEPESGKTRNFEIAEHLVARPWRVVEASEAVVFRKIDAERPTVMLDEVDALWGARADGREGLRGVLNEGYRRGATVPRCVGEGQTLTDFAVFCAKAFAGIGDLPRTIATRAIPIRMQRRAKSEPVERFSIRHTPPTLWPLRDRLAAWVALVADELAHAKPGMPASLSDRQVDIWEPLLAIADAAGGDWPTRARTAAVELHGHDPTADPGVGALLLSHIRDAFDTEPMDAIASDKLLRALVGRDDGPWGDWWAGDMAAKNVRGPASKLAKLLRPYGIKPDQVWTYQGKTRGYRREWFAKAFELYIPTPADEETVGEVPTDSEDGRTVDPSSEALSDLRRDNPDMGADQRTTVLPFSQSVEGVPTVPAGLVEGDAVAEPMFDSDDPRRFTQ
jgi:hypothetical protein